MAQEVHNVSNSEIKSKNEQASVGLDASELFTEFGHSQVLRILYHIAQECKAIDCVFFSYGLALAFSHEMLFLKRRNRAAYRQILWLRPGRIVKM